MPLGMGSGNGQLCCPPGAPGPRHQHRKPRLGDPGGYEIARGEPLRRGQPSSIADDAFSIAWVSEKYKPGGLDRGGFLTSGGALRRSRPSSAPAAGARSRSGWRSARITWIFCMQHIGQCQETATESPDHAVMRLCDYPGVGASGGRPAPPHVVRLPSTTAGATPGSHAHPSRYVSVGARRMSRDHSMRGTDASEPILRSGRVRCMVAMVLAGVEDGHGRFNGDARVGRTGGGPRATDRLDCRPHCHRCHRRRGRRACHSTPRRSCRACSRPLAPAGPAPARRRPWPAG
jgi:hypothetical protein